MQGTLRYLLLIVLISPSVLSTQLNANEYASGSGNFAAILDGNNGWQIGYSYVATDQGGWYTIDIQFSETDLNGGGCVNWEVFIKNVNSSAGSSTTLCSGTQSLGIGAAYGDTIRFGLYNPYLPINNGSGERQIYTEFTPAPSVCQDINETFTISNTSGSIRDYYWLMSGNSGTYPAETNGNLWPSISLGPGESTSVNVVLDAEDNPDCVTIRLKSCSAFNTENPDPDCGDTEFEASADPSEDYPDLDPNNGGTQNANVDYDEISSPSLDPVNIDPSTSDLATREGQEKQINNAQELAKWQQTQNYNNTQNIVNAIENNSSTGGNVNVDTSGIETRIDETNTSLTEIETALTEETYDSPLGPSEDGSDADAQNSKITNIITGASQIVTNLENVIPEAPTLPTSIGKSHLISVDFAWHGIPPFDIDFSTYDTFIDWFRLMLLWLIYLATFVKIVTLVRSSMAG